MDKKMKDISKAQIGDPLMCADDLTVDDIWQALVARAVIDCSGNVCLTPASRYALRLADDIALGLIEDGFGVVDIDSVSLQCVG